MKTLLIIGHTYPEPSTTAAGSRMMQLISLFKEQGFDITFACTASPSERSVKLSNLDITVETIALNHSSFDAFIIQLNPTLVLFDRYIMEEQFGWRVAENCPNTIRILDTEDLHFLRKAREEAIKNNIPVDEAYLFSETAKRELASIYRCDMSLIISEAEMEILQQTFNIDQEILFYLPFLVGNDPEKALPSFDNRIYFISIGNFLHAPNVDSVLYLKNKIWPLIRQKLPLVQLHLYGDYAPPKILELHNEKEGFLIKGWTEDITRVMSNARICLAPLRFGAGLKGKLMDAIVYGTPSITTTIGAEGMCGQWPFSGIVSDDIQSFAEASVELYTNKEKWLLAQERGFNILDRRFRKNLFSEAFKKHMTYLQNNLTKHRKNNFIGQILQHHTLKSTKYLSKWIEEKNK